MRRRCVATALICGRWLILSFSAAAHDECSLIMMMLTLLQGDGGAAGPRLVRATAWPCPLALPKESTLMSSSSSIDADEIEVGRGGRVLLLLLLLVVVGEGAVAIVSVCRRCVVWAFSEGPLKA